MVCPAVVSRMEWHASPANASGLTFYNASTPVHFAVFMSTITSTCWTVESCSRATESMQTYHMGKARKYADIGYNFLIGGNGEILEGRGWKVAPDDHYCNRFKQKCYTIAFIGNFTGVESPSYPALQSARSLLNCADTHKYLFDKVLLRGLHINGTIVDQLRETTEQTNGVCRNAWKIATGVLAVICLLTVGFSIMLVQKYRRKAAQANENIQSMNVEFLADSCAGFDERDLIENRYETLAGSSH